MTAATGADSARRGEESASISSMQPTFNRPADRAQWSFDGSGSWEIANHLLILSKAGVPAGSVRRPAALAVLKGSAAPHVTLESDIRSTAPVEVVNRDLEMVFGYQSPTRFYYAHLAGITNDVHNGVFLVADADRRRLDDGTAPPQRRSELASRAARARQRQRTNPGLRRSIRHPCMGPCRQDVASGSCRCRLVRRHRRVPQPRGDAEDRAMTRRAHPLLWLLVLTISLAHPVQAQQPPQPLVIKQLAPVVYWAQGGAGGNSGISSARRA